MGLPLAILIGLLTFLAILWGLELLDRLKGK